MTNSRLRPAVKNKGFTLIEMMVAVVIMGVLVGGGIAAYRRFNDKQVILTAGKEVVVRMRGIQKKAKAGTKPESGCGTLSGYKFAVLAGSNVGVISVVCDGGVAEVEQETVVLPSGLEYKDNVTVVFRVLTQGSDVGILRLGDVGGNYIYAVEINESGAVNDLGLEEI